jgi:SRSO17 transposase
MKHARVAKTRSSCRRERGHRAARTKPEIALAEIDRVIASGVRFGCVLADSGYGSSGPFRQALSERGLQRNDVIRQSVAINIHATRESQIL